MPAAAFVRHELGEYEQRGGPDRPFELSKADHRRQRAREELVESVRRSLETNPPPPMSPEAMDQIALILRSVERRDHELVIWRLRLYCGHVVERSAHGSHLTLHGAFTDYATCPICGEEKSIVAGRAIGYAAGATTAAAPAEASGAASEEAHSGRT